MPPSKSVAARVLVAAALAGGRSRVRHLPDATDTRVLVRGLRALGATVTRAPPSDATVEGLRLPAERSPARIDVADAGTAMRFLTVLAALGGGPTTLDGSGRMRERPSGPLTRALSVLGVRATDRGGYPPVVVAGGPPAGGAVTVDASVSSQFASGLLLVGPVLARGLDLTLAGPPVSAPYLELTVDAMARFGGLVQREGACFRVAPGGYDAADVEVEGDWSSACFPLAAAAVTGGTVTVTGVAPRSRQPDAIFPDLLSRMGVEVSTAEDAVRCSGRPSAGLEVDLAHAPDAVPALAVVAATAPTPTTIRGVAHLRTKESDRLEAVAEGLRLMGAGVAILEDGLRIEPAALRGARIDPRGDHRIAMAFGVLGLAVGRTTIETPGCVAKSYPAFWDDLARLEG